jgi:Arc/MetJ-type ribon-helix-helix transcriptional regulator
MINWGTMTTMKVAVTLDIDALREVDRLIRAGRFSSRSGAVQAALAEMLARGKRSRLAEESAKLDPREERALAEEGLLGELVSPEY